VNSLDKGEVTAFVSLRGQLRSPVNTQSQIRPDELLPVQSEHFASLSGYIATNPAAR